MCFFFNLNKLQTQTIPLATSFDGHVHRSTEEIL